MSNWMSIEAGWLNLDHVVVVHHQSIVMSTGNTVELLPAEFKALEKHIRSTKKKSK
mgnify:FL=1